MGDREAGRDQLAAKRCWPLIRASMPAPSPVQPATMRRTLLLAALLGCIMLGAQAAEMAE